MSKPWDEAMKKLVAASPQEIVDWLVPEGQFIEVLNTELPKDNEEPLRSDNCLAITIRGKPWTLLVEVQSSADPDIPERMLEYSLRVKRIDLRHRPVYACVIYVRPVGTVPQPPFTEKDPYDGEMTRYHYQSIELAALDPQELLDMHQPGILPLLTLTKNAATPEVAETMFTGLQATGRRDLVAIAMLLASLSFGKENISGQEWLTRKESQMYDILEDTPIFQRWTGEARKQGLEEGLEKGREEGLQKGKLESLRETLLTVVQAHFPQTKLKRMAKRQAAMIDDPAVLQNLIVQVSLAQTAEEAQTSLLEWPDTDEE